MPISWSGRKKNQYAQYKFSEQNMNKAAELYTKTLQETIPNK